MSEDGLQPDPRLLDNILTSDERVSSSFFLRTGRVLPAFHKGILQHCRSLEQATGKEQSFQVD